MRRGCAIVVVNIEYRWVLPSELVKQVSNTRITGVEV